MTRKKVEPSVFKIIRGRVEGSCSRDEHFQFLYVVLIVPLASRGIKPNGLCLVALAEFLTVM